MGRHSCRRCKAHSSQLRRSANYGVPGLAASTRATATRFGLAAMQLATGACCSMRPQLAATSCASPPLQLAKLQLASGR